MEFVGYAAFFLFGWVMRWFVTMRTSGKRGSDHNWLF